MEYSKLRNKVGKFYNGGKVQKFYFGGKFTDEQKQQLRAMGFSDNDIVANEANGMSFEQLAGPNLSQTVTSVASSDIASISENELGSDGDQNNIQTSSSSVLGQIPTLDQMKQTIQRGLDTNKKDIDKINNRIKDEAGLKKVGSALNSAGQAISGVDFSADASWRDSGLSEGGAMGMGIASKVGVGAMKAIDAATMGDKNFGAQSQAIDSAVHGVSSALMSSGNPYAMAAGAALEGANFLTKAGGQTVQGFDVNIENSGFGNVGHMESSSSRDFGAMIGLGGLNAGKMQAKLARRNEQARMALQAAEISEDVKFEQEARMNSVDNVLRNNQIALAGGIDTSLLGS